MEDAYITEIIAKELKATTNFIKQSSQKWIHVWTRCWGLKKMAGNK
jgi:hypothetical protein